MLFHYLTWIIVYPYSIVLEENFPSIKVYEIADGKERGTFKKIIHFLFKSSMSSAYSKKSN